MKQPTKQFSQQNKKKTEVDYQLPEEWDLHNIGHLVAQLSAISDSKLAYLFFVHMFWEYKTKEENMNSIHSRKEENTCWKRTKPPAIMKAFKLGP